MSNITGPKKGEFRGSTRLAALIGRIARKAGAKAVRIPIASLARTIGYAPETVRKLTMTLRTRPWFFKGYHAVIFITHQTSEKAPRGFPVLWVINRHQVHRIYAQPGSWRQLRWHWRKGSALDWATYARRIKKWALAIIFGKIGASDGKHKGYSPQGGSASAQGARSPPAKSSRLRRFEKVALGVELAYARLEASPPAKLRGWIVNRLEENHAVSEVIASLRHAAEQFQRRNGFAVTCAASWISAVAKYRLDQDGLVPRQRRTGPRRQAAGAAASNEVFDLVERETPAPAALDEPSGIWYKTPPGPGLWQPKEKK
jgi:hypothetical protein